MTAVFQENDGLRNRNKTEQLVRLSGKDISRLTVYTGHWPIDEHAVKKGVPHNNFCHSCKNVEEKETVYQFLCECPELSNKTQSTAKTTKTDVGETKNARLMLDPKLDWSR